MRHGGNYARHLADSLDHARDTSKRLGSTSSAAETRFARLLPYGETPHDLSAASRSDDGVVSMREAFRAAHKAHVDALSLQAIIEDGCFEHADDGH